ncbi:MAG TPA: hypothetical protein VFQ60_03455 [Patescibacteria group bacterium]|nr:hypothetical protein [Patescibacteria group bacterium]
MDKEFYILQLNKNQLTELHRALISRLILEIKLREAQGLEAVSFPMLLEKIERLLGLPAKEAHQLLHQGEDELWEYSWYAFTDEWAWHRAKQDVLKKLGQDASRTHAHALKKLIERQYEEKFDAYVAEITVDEDEKSKNIKREK